jgi:hypothetical protein
MWPQNILSGRPNPRPKLPRAESRRKARFRQFAALTLAVLTVAASPLSAYIDQLNEAEVDEAYTLGQRHDQDLVKFFRSYEVQFPNAAQGMRVSRIAIRTPYCAVVLNSFERGSIYPMSQARADYAANPYPFVAVVSVTLPFAYSWARDDLSNPKGRFWKQFEIELSQNGRIAPRDRKARPLYSIGADNSSIIGAEITLEYDVRDVASRALEIRVTGPDRQPVSASFDLDNLR